MASQNVTISALGSYIGQEVEVKGWLYNARASGKVQFLVVRDGSGMCQCVFEKTADNEQLFKEIKHLGQESAIIVTGLVRQEPRSEGGYELALLDIEIVHKAEGYPITPKQHGTDFLMKNRHLHLRSKKQWALARLRHTIIESLRGYFNNLDFTLVDTPIFAPAAGEGEQTLFNVDYFGEEVALSQTGQLYLESAALSLGKVYCLGPTFRAEKSKTRRHLTEFWMLEPEVAYIDLDGLFELAEGMLCDLVKDVLEKRRPELEILGQDIGMLESIKAPFYRLSYTEAVDLLHSDKAKEYLQKDLEMKTERVKELESSILQWTEDEKTARKQWQKDKLANQIKSGKEEVTELQKQVKNIPGHMELAANFKWGKDLGGSDETIISNLYDRPIFVHRYPKDVKAFYMQPDPEDERLVLNFDCLAPQGYGEIIGGSMREICHAAMVKRITDEGYNMDDYLWYLDLRKFGSVPHGGFGLGIERTVAWIAGIKHIRETIAFPRMMGKIYP